METASYSGMTFRTISSARPLSLLFTNNFTEAGGVINQHDDILLHVGIRNKDGRYPGLITNQTHHEVILSPFERERKGAIVFADGLMTEFLDFNTGQGQRFFSFYSLPRRSAYKPDRAAAAANEQAKNKILIFISS